MRVCIAGFNVETVEYKNICFTVWDVGGQDKVRSTGLHKSFVMSPKVSFLTSCPLALMIPCCLVADSSLVAPLLHGKCKLRPTLFAGLNLITAALTPQEFSFRVPSGLTVVLAVVFSEHPRFNLCGRFER